MKYYFYLSKGKMINPKYFANKKTLERGTVRVQCFNCVFKKCLVSFDAQDMQKCLFSLQGKRYHSTLTWGLGFGFPKILGKCFSGSPSPYKHIYIIGSCSLYIHKYSMYA